MSGATNGFAEQIAGQVLLKAFMSYLKKKKNKKENFSVSYLIPDRTRGFASLTPYDCSVTRVQKCKTLQAYTAYKKKIT